MTAEQIYQAWAPDDARWSPWVKPVLFAHTSAVVAELELASAVERSWAPPVDDITAVVIDLPAVHSVLAGLSLAEKGYQPVPLFNSVPAMSSGVIDMYPVVSALIRGAEKLASLRYRPQAPPAFLLDARRRGEGAAGANVFDNRSISLPTDFPSANLLLSVGIKRALLIHELPGQPRRDLAHTLRRWQEGGIQILADSPYSPEPPEPIHIERPPWFRHIWYGLLARFGLRRNPLGGYGGFIPEPSSSG